ncbi:hypothetical protein HOI26_00615 [Candidatus Woesearchaeota archaeon]|jgi:hypothetical protein|nr:hypothetical protein [Candidatus Woesearchaeota archaeon]MBT5739576.1 hypothetical protein [Candidatus Woesearchaeota archaeon]
MKKECSYCSNEFSEEWRSEWGENKEQHYKSIVCSNCGKKDCVRVAFYSSGDTHKPKNSSLESMLRKVRQ